LALTSTSKKSTAVTGFLQQIGPRRPGFRGEFGFGNMGTLLLGIALLGRFEPLVDGEESRGPIGRLVTASVLRFVTAAVSILGKLPTPLISGD
jgi:hypothetical protein